MATKKPDIKAMAKRSHRLNKKKFKKLWDKLDEKVAQRVKAVELLERGNQT